MSIATPSPHRKLWEERSVVVSLVLAILVPGLGHLYQGRIVKGLIYLFGILGLFFWGVKLGEGVVVYNMADQGISKRVTLHYAAQFGAGAVSYAALLQKPRVNRPDNHAVSQLDEPLSAPFSGRLISDDDSSGKLEGTVNLKPESGQFGPETIGTFTGTLDGKHVELKLAGSFMLDRPIAAGFRRSLKCGVVGDNNALTGNRIDGWIPRSIMNGYGVPPDPAQLQEVTGRLGKLHELALVFTWIAGLLNILAIWDCVQGPAYGFGDEPWSTSPDNSSEPAKTPAPTPVNTTATPA